MGRDGVGIDDRSDQRDITGGGIPCGGGSTRDSHTDCGPAANAPTSPAGTTDPTGTGTDDNTGNPAPPLPPPTHDEIITAVCPDLPPAEIGHNPREYGITGMHTWLWSAGDNTTKTTSGVIRGYPVDCILAATTFQVDTNDPNAARYGHRRTYTATAPGSETATTEMQHFWETKGTYQLTLTVTWQRITTVGTDYPTRTATVDYPVKEVVIGMATPDS